VGCRRESFKKFKTPDINFRRTLAALDAQKLSDPSVLARLTARYGQQRRDGEGNTLPNGLP